MVQSLVETRDEMSEVGALRSRLREVHVDGVDPETMWELAKAYGYELKVSWSAQDSGEYFEARLLDKARADQVARAEWQPPGSVQSWSAYANDPLDSGFKQQLIPQLREYLKGRLPEYMMPSAWVVLKELPLTSNGKVDRRALPNPQARLDEMGEYVAPRTDVERALSELWTQLLHVNEIGVKDNFFELGGHSLHAMKLIAKVSEQFSVRLSVVAVFQYPTIEQMANLVESLRSGGEQSLHTDGMEFDEGVIEARY